MTYRHAHPLAMDLMGWDLTLFQLDAGTFLGQLKQLVLPDLTIAQFQANRSLEFLGTSPRGRRTLVILASDRQHLTWFGQQMTGNHLLVLPPHTKVLAATPANHQAYFISVKERVLAEMLARDPRSTMPQALLADRPNMIEAPDLNRIRTILKDPDWESAPCLLHDILAPLATANVSPPRPQRRRDQALIRAHSLIQQCKADHLTVQDLCAAGRVSERTLQYAFVEQFGINPKRYLVVHRLNRARNDLIRFESSQIKISEAAIRHGFWHMGSFAADYRMLFGELPSQTLRHARQQHNETCLNATHTYAHQDLGAGESITLETRDIQ